MAADPVKITKRLDALKAKRSGFESDWRDCFEMTFPERGSGLSGEVIDSTQARSKTAARLDSTGTDASRILASALMSGMTPANSRWFALDVGNESDEERKWLDDAADTIWENIHAANFDAAAFECMLDVVPAGWCVLFTDINRHAGGGYAFEQWPISECFIASTRQDGRVDTVYRKYALSALQAAETFGIENLSSKSRDKVLNKPDDLIQFVRAVEPRKVYAAGAKLSRNMPFASCDVELDGKHPVREQGFEEFPCSVPRWTIIPQSHYAVGPAFHALPDMLELTELVRLEKAAADLAVSGMWIAEDDGVLNPRTVKVGPRKIIIANSVDSMKELKSGADFSVSFTMKSQLQAQIRKTLMADQLQPQDGPAMTATEVHVRVNLIRQLLGPVYGPASFVAQNAATREILQAADYSKLADQYDPFDPVGLALSTVLPLGFGALAMRGAKVKGKTPDAPTMHPPEEVVDAARVSLIRQHMDSTNPVPDDIGKADAHVKAYTTAMDQQAAGERVSVDLPEDVALRASLEMDAKLRESGAQADAVPDVATFMADSGMVLPDVPVASAAAAKGNAFVAWLKDAGGVAWSQKVDIVGERGVRGNYAGIFTKKGQNLDVLVESAVQAGYLSRADVENANDVGGTRALAELIRRATTGEKVPTVESAQAAKLADGQARANMDAVDQMERELQSLGVDTAAARGNPEALSAYLAEHRTALVNRKLSDIEAETKAERMATGEAYNLTPKQIDEQSRIALAAELDENAMHDAAMNARDQTDFLNRIEEIINNAPRSRKTVQGSAGSAQDGGVSPRDGQATASSAIPRDANLSPADQAIEQRLADKVTQDFPAAVAEYNARPDSMGGKVLNTDIARELSPEYLKDRTKSAAVHEPSSYFIKQLYAKKLAELQPGRSVLFTSGGTGAGKTTAIENVPAVKWMLDEAGMVYDTNMNSLDSAVKKIEQALAAGAPVEIVHVQRDAVDALVNGALPRAARQAKEFGTGRTVPLSAHAATHKGAAEVIVQLAEKYKDDPRVMIQIIDNTQGKNRAAPSTLDFVKGFDYNGIEGRLYEALKQQYDAGAIPESVFRATAGDANPGAGPVPRSNDGGINQRPGDGAGFNPSALAAEASQLLSDGRSPGEVIGQLQAAGGKVSPELQNMLIGASEFGGRINDLVDQVTALKAQRGPNTQPFDLIAQAVENLRNGTKVDAPKPANPLDARLADIEVRNPTALDAEIPIEFDSNGKPTSTMTAREYLDMVKKEASQDAADASLLEVAANCFISGGM